MLSLLFLAVFQVKKIALVGQQFARNNLMGDRIFCYYYKLFQVTFLQLERIYESLSSSSFSHPRIKVYCSVF